MSYKSKKVKPKQPFVTIEINTYGNSVSIPMLFAMISLELKELGDTPFSGKTRFKMKRDGTISEFATEKHKLKGKQNAS